MSSSLRTAATTRAAFLAWVARDDGRRAFGEVAPVARSVGTRLPARAVRHAPIPVGAFCGGARLPAGSRLARPYGKAGPA